ncbi:TRAP transporter substrate-binding protein [Hoeflea sp. CAU 1731]
MLPPVTTHHNKVLVPWAEMLEEKSDGRLKVTIFPGSSLCKPTEQYNCVEAGLADISYGIPGWSPNKFPRTSVLELPFLFKTAETGSQMLEELWGEYISEDYPDVQILAMNVHPSGHIHTSETPVRNIDDLKGLRIRAPTAVTGDIIEGLGGSKVGLPSSEIYQAMSQGTIDGFVLNHEGVLAFKLNEVTKYHTELSMYSTVFATFMNKQSLAKLPDDLQKLVIESTAPGSGYWADIGAIWDGNDQNARNALSGDGHEIITLSPEERAEWRKMVEGMDETWVSNAEANGVSNARALLEEARALAEQHGESN